MKPFEHHFDTAFDAPDGIKKLRELILTLAIQGKLTTSQSNTLPIERVNLKDIALKIGSGSTPSGGRDSYATSGIPLIRSMNVHFGGFKADGLAYINETQAEKLNNVVVREADVLLNITGASIGRVTLAPAAMEGARVNQHVCIIRPDKRVLPRYLEAYLASPIIQQLISDVQVGATREALTKSMIEQFTIELPSIRMQARIVAKIDELMARCDAFEKLRAERDAKRLAVHSAAVRQLLNGSDTDGHIQAREFLGQHFGELYTVKENVTELRKAILQLAVMGKLVPQAPNDPSASELLNQIETEKKKLVKDGKLREAKNLVITGGEMHGGDLPQGWACTQLQNLVAIVTDGDHQPPPKADRGVPFLVIGNLNKMTIDFADCRFVARDYYDALDWTRRPKRRDVLYTVTGSYGIPIVVDRDEEFCVQRHVAIFKSTPSTPVEYLSWVLKSENAISYATNIATGIAQKTVPLTGLRTMPVPLPPLAEQRRIVAKIDQLMSLCDTLEQQIDAARATQSSLLGAMMAQYGGQRCA